MFKTKCPACGKDGCLYVVAGSFESSGVPLQKDGFALAEASSLSTQDEMVMCSRCGRDYMLDDLTYEEKPKARRKT